ncbi:Anaerobic dimethyl sulfoxide reductase chain A, partial [Salmonella enterica subsp. enterica serovar Alachua str. R6-377]
CPVLLAWRARAFIARYAIGFDEDSMPEGVPANESLVAYLTGAKDGVVKSPEWAEKITHVPAQTIRQLARDYANTKPAALIQGWGPQRHNCGERTGAPVYTIAVGRACCRSTATLSNCSVVRVLRPRILAGFFA